MKRWGVAILIMLFVACSGNNPPKGILSEKEMIPILVDFHLAEGVYGIRFSQKITSENYSDNLYLAVLRKYKLDQKVFEQSVFYYGQYPDRYKRIYDEVLNRLNELEVKSKAKDSIMNIK